MVIKEQRSWAIGEDGREGNGDERLWTELKCQTDIMREEITYVFILPSQIKVEVGIGGTKLVGRTAVGLLRSRRRT